MYDAITTFLAFFEILIAFVPFVVVIISFLPLLCSCIGMENFHILVPESVMHFFHLRKCNLCFVYS